MSNKCLLDTEDVLTCIKDYLWECDGAVIAEV